MAVMRCVIVGICVLGIEAVALAQVPAPAPFAAPAPVPAVEAGQVAAPRSPRLTGFSAVLLTGELDASASTRAAVADADVPAAVKDALASIMAFLPYKTYKLTDAAMVATAGNASMLLRDREALNLGTLRLAVGLNGSPNSGQLYTGVVLQRIDQSGTTKEGGLDIIRTTVPLSLGETVVVGTSPVPGNQAGRKAYILLLTALTNR